MLFRRKGKFATCIFTKCVHMQVQLKSFWAQSVRSVLTVICWCYSDIVPSHYEAVKGRPDAMLNGNDAGDGRAPGAASTATRELDDLMDSLSDFKVPVLTFSNSKIGVRFDDFPNSKNNKSLFCLVEAKVKKIKKEKKEKNQHGMVVCFLPDLFPMCRWFFADWLTT